MRFFIGQSTKKILVSISRLSLGLNRPRLRKNGLPTPFCVGVTIKRQQQITVFIEILHYTVIYNDFTFLCDSFSSSFLFDELAKSPDESLINVMHPDSRLWCVRQTVVPHPGVWIMEARFRWSVAIYQTTKNIDFK